ncbi:MAG: RagB/SusD family nutrient uptake outer membrane protein, partial [Bacteroidales bacterium]
QLFMLNVTSNGEIVKSYYRADKIGNANNVAITYPEVLLMCAEANARKGNLTVALSDLNILRKYRYTGTDTDLANGSSLTQDQLLNEILTERRRELPIGTISRLLDLKRFQFDSGKPWCKTVIEHKFGSQTYSAKVSDAVFNKPIDNVILSYNPDWGVAADTRTWAPK